MDQNEFLKGLKQGKTCENYAIKFKNTYIQYIENENLEHKDFIIEHNISDLEFEAKYLDDWNSKWFYIGQDIISFYNAMNWDFKELSSSKKTLYSPEYDTNYKNYVIQDIWDNLLNETDSETVCWGVYNFISILQNTDEQQSLKNDLQALMDELYQFVPDETETSAKGKLSEYIKDNKGIECAFGHIEIAIKDCLGQGGNGIVYSGTLEETSVAVKFLVNYTKDKLKRFMAEYLNVSIASQKLHHAVNYLHYETLQLGDVRIPCIIMEKYSSSLKQYRKKMRQITWEDLIKLFYDLCDALKSLETNSIIHRDLKPDNILIDDNGDYILTDFGIAHFESDDYPIKGLTKKGDRMANWEFCAPEQVTGGKISFATDIYAFGQILYWFCFNTINRGHGGEHLTSLFDNDKAAILDDIIYKSISNNSADRYQNIEEIEAYFADSCKKSPDVYDDMQTFSDTIRSVIPEAYSKPYNTNNKVIINDLIESLNKTSFNHELCYNTGIANDSFSSIKYLESGNYLLNEREIAIEEIWAMVDTRVYSDLLLLKISNPEPYVVNGNKTSSIAIINKTITEPLDMVASGYYRFSDGHVESVNDLDIETRHIYDDTEKYIVIGPYKNCSTLPKNDSIIFNLQEQEPLIPDFISDLKRQLSTYKADEVLLGI